MWFKQTAARITRDHLTVPLQHLRGALPGAPEGVRSGGISLLSEETAPRSGQASRDATPGAAHDGGRAPASGSQAQVSRPRRPESASGQRASPQAAQSPLPAPAGSRPAETAVLPAGNGRTHTRPSHAGGAAAPAGNGSNRAPSAAPAMIDVAGVPAPPAYVPDPTTAELAVRADSRRRTMARMGLIALVLLLVGEVALFAPFLDPAATATPRVPHAVPLSEVQPYGVNTFLHKEVDSWKKNTTVAMARDMGAAWIKQQFPWAEIEYRLDPERPFWDVKNNQNAWTKFDNIASLAGQNGLRIIARIDSTPAWARPEGSSPKAPPSPERMADFGNFIFEFVRRYRGSVSAIQVWNEPNLHAEWDTGRPVNPAEYAEMLKVAYTRAKEANPDIIVLAAPLATNNEHLAYDGNLNELDYMQGLYDAGASGYFDAMAANAYGTTYPPEDEPSREKLNFRRVELLHDVMARNGDADKSVWFNEYGWNASPPDMPESELRWGRVTPEQQADYTVRGIEYAREHWPWAGVFTIWYLRQVGDIPRSKSEYYFGLVDGDFLRTKAYLLVTERANTVDKVAAPGEWGPLSPPVQAPPDWQIRLSDRVPGGAYVSPLSVGDKLTVPFLGTDVKVTLVPSEGGSEGEDNAEAARYYVTIDGSTGSVAPELPRDETGAAYMVASAGGEPAEVTVAHGLNAETRTGRHTLEITVVAGPAQVQPEGGKLGGRTFAPVVQQPNLPGIGTIKVEVHRSYLLFLLLTLALLAGIAFAIWALRRGRPTPEAAAPTR